MRKSVGVRVRAFGILAMVVLARVRQKSTFVHRLDEFCSAHATRKWRDGVTPAIAETLRSSPSYDSRVVRVRGFFVSWHLGLEEARNPLSAALYSFC